MLDQVEWHKTAQVVVSVICPLVISGDIWQLQKLDEICVPCAKIATVLTVLTMTHQSDGLPGSKINDITSQGRFPPAELMAQMAHRTSSLLLTLSYLGCAMATCKMFTPLGIAWGPWGIPLCFFDDLYHNGGPYGPNARSSTCLLQYSPNRSAQKGPETQTRTHEKFKLSLGTTKWVDGGGNGVTSMPLHFHDWQPSRIFAPSSSWVEKTSGHNWPCLSNLLLGPLQRVPKERIKMNTLGWCSGEGWVGPRELSGKRPQRVCSS